MLYSLADIENAFYQTLIRDATLYGYTAGKIYTGLDIGEVKAKLGTVANSALINVSYFSDELSAKHGSKTHHLCTGEGQIQIDAATNGGKALAMLIAKQIRSLIYNDVSITIAGNLYDISVGDVKTLISYNEDAAAWVAAVRASVEYDTEGE